MGAVWKNIANISQRHLMVSYDNIRPVYGYNFSFSSMTEPNLLLALPSYSGVCMVIRGSLVWTLWTSLFPGDSVMDAATTNIFT
jgi:hypothetical protein